MRGFQKAFTLLELMLVVAIMGFMATISIGGYRAMRQGMDQSNVMRNVDQFIHNAYLRAMIDYQPTAIYFWNEVLQQESDDGTNSTAMVVVGRAVAIRRAGRITAVRSSNYLYDEFGDWGFENGDSEGTGASAKLNYKYIYQMNGSEDNKCFRSAVEPTPVLDDSGTSEIDNMLTYPNFATEKTGSNPAIRQFYYKIITVKDEVGGKATWEPGDAYAFEFDTMTLPNNYIFGSSTPSGNSDKTIQAVNCVIWSEPGIAPTKTIEISAMRPNENGELQPKIIGTTQNAALDTTKRNY